MRKLLCVLFAMIIALPALAVQNVNVTVVDENEDPIVGASVMVENTTRGESTNLNGIATLKNVPDDAQITISFLGYESQTLEAKPTLQVELKVANTTVDDVVVPGACNPKPSDGIKTQKLVGNKCVPDKCYSPCYEFNDSGECELQTIQGGEWTLPIVKKTNNSNEIDYEKTVCVLTCDEDNGYKKSDDGESCIRDCLDILKKTEPLATEATEDDNGKCIIKKCDKKDGKKYVPSDDGQSCEPTERPCDKTKDAAIWPEHATGALYKKSKTGSATCHANACEDGFDPVDGECISVNDSDCAKKPENSKKSHRYYDKSTNQTLCLIDECKKGYTRTKDMLSCILESVLSEEDAEERMKQLKDNAQKMKDREQSTENKMLGAAGIGAVGIGGMNITSALAEKNADEDAEQDMKAYLATFRCDYGQGRNILGGEKNIQLPGASELIEYTTEYKQLAANLKADKEALGMMPGIESEVVFDSATTGLYDDVSIGRQKGAFTSLSRALLDENSADAAEWQAMKDKTAKKLKTGLVVAGVGATASLAGNIIVNHGKGDKSRSIMDIFEKKKKPIQDMTPERIPCSKYEGTKNNGEFAPNCDCQDENAYFDNKENKCITCGTNQHVENNGCKCNEGYYDKDMDNNCEIIEEGTKCEDFTDRGATGNGDYPNCECKDSKNAKFNSDNGQCECQPGGGYSLNAEGMCTQTCVGLQGVDNDKAATETYPNCTCKNQDETFDTEVNACTCPAGKERRQDANGTTICGAIESDNNPNQEEPLFAGNFPATNTFDRGSDGISDAKCNDLVNQITKNSDYQKNKNRSGNIYICATGRTDTSWFKRGVLPTLSANATANEKLSKRRADAVYKCLSGKIKTLFPNSTLQISATNGVGWTECYEPKDTRNPAPQNKDIPYCRNVTVVIQAKPCTY